MQKGGNSVKEKIQIAMKLTIYGSNVNIILESDARITSFESGSSMRSGLFFNDRSSIAYNFYHTFRNLMIAFKK